MHADDLNHEQLLQLDKAGGTIHFAGHRTLIIDPASLGVLRKYLVENVGVAATRAVLTRFGFEHGWKTAQAMQNEYAWDNEEERQRAGLRLLVLEGLLRVETPSAGLLGEDGVMVLDSYEAQEHVVQLGRADTSTCWAICGLLSGYLSQVTGEPIFVLEDRCVGRGDAGCQLIGRTREAWGPSRAADLSFFAAEPLVGVLDQSLVHATETLKLTERQLKEHRRALFNVGAEIVEPSGLVARSPAMRATVDLARRVAKVDARVLITGESGTGKERVARLIHDESARAAGPVRRRQLRRHPRDAARERALRARARRVHRRRRGPRRASSRRRTAARSSSTRLARCRPSMQAKLLRVLQEREVRRVGENRSRPIDVRVRGRDATATLSAEVAERRFPRDLYYRLNVVELRVPPLRERREDVLPLAQLFSPTRFARDARSKRLAPRRPRAAAAPATAGRATCASSRTPWSAPSRWLAGRAWNLKSLARGGRSRCQRGDAHGLGAAAGRHREGLHHRRARSERRQSDPYRAATEESARPRCTASSSATASSPAAVNQCRTERIRRGDVHRWTTAL